MLDTHSGKPQAGIAIELVRDIRARCSVAWLPAAITNSDGRTDQPLIRGRPVPIGRYELSFSVGRYFSRAACAASDPPFLDSIPLRFRY